MLGPMADLARSYAEKVGLEIDWSDPAATVSKLALITQTPEEFDFPGNFLACTVSLRRSLSRRSGQGPVPFPWDQLTGEPLIYASLGTLVNGLDDVYKHILKAVEPPERCSSCTFCR
jgi:zeaxanthin glucosyltransferase